MSSRAPKTTAYAQSVLNKLQFLQNPYFQALKNGEMSLEVFRKTQEQFYFAVTFFPRPMAALVAKIPEPKARLDILHNLLEEHGELHPEAFHETTFRKFLKNIGSPIEDFNQVSLWPELRAFNSVLTASCVLDEMEVGVCCMGIIEFSFSSVSALIAKAVLQRGWLTPELLSHYQLHEEIDTRHAEEFFAVVEPLWNREDRRYFIQQGLELGAYVFHRLYRDLYISGSQL